MRVQGQVDPMQNAEEECGMRIRVETRVGCGCAKQRRARLTRVRALSHVSPLSTASHIPLLHSASGRPSRSPHSFSAFCNGSNLATPLWSPFGGLYARHLPALGSYRPH